MQMQSRHQFQVDTLVASNFGIQQNSTGIELLKSMQTLAGTVNNLHQQHADPTTYENLGIAIDAAAGVIERAIPTIHEENEQSQSRVDSATAAAEWCAESPIFGDATMHRLGDELIGKRETHVACRVEEDRLNGLKSAACNDLSDFMHRLPYASCGMSGRDNIIAMDNMFDEMYNYVSAYRGIFKEKQQACHDAEDYHNEAVQCSPLQSQFEIAYCGYSDKCAVLDDCWNREKNEFDVIIASEREVMEARQHQYRSLVQSQCILGLIRTAVTSGELIETASVQACGDNIVIDGINDLFLDITQPEAPTACADADTLPASCTAPFFGVEYGALPQRQDIEQTCIACLAIDDVQDDTEDQMD